MEETSQQIQQRHLKEFSHPDREAPEVRRLRPNLETEAIATEVAMAFEREQGCQVFDVHEKNLGYDLTSLDLHSGELRLIEVKGIGEATGTVLLTPTSEESPKTAATVIGCILLRIVIQNQ